jgi:hypothetical protein
MFFLNTEPGYYKENHFGVRLETILEVITKVPNYNMYLQMLSNYEFVGLFLIRKNNITKMNNLYEFYRTKQWVNI